MPECFKPRDKSECIDSSQVAEMVINISSEDDMREKIFKKKYYCKNNKRKKQQPFPDLDTFKFTDYDCIGFDLDNTVCRYKIGNLLRLEYKLISEYLVHKYGYEECLLLPLDDDMDFMQKGLLLDIRRGNFLKCASNGTILRATHGMKPLTRDNIKEIYGSDRIFDPVIDFARSFYDQGPTSNDIRSFKDYFDMATSVAIARVIDAQDRSPEGPIDDYTDLWRDVHAAMCSLYRKEYFRCDKGGYFTELKEHPENYLYEASDRLKKWLKSINEHTFTCLISGSSLDYASHIAEFTLGPDWRDYFDIMVCTSKKPGFFTENRPFLCHNDFDIGDEVPPYKLKIDGTYAHGNWNDLLSLIKRETSLDDPHCLYVGDHLCQDIFIPAMMGIDTVAIVEEMAAEGMCGDSMDHDAGSDLMSTYWGSFFTTDGDKNLFGQERINTLYGSILLGNTRLAIPALEAVATKPIKHQFSAFTNDTSGFFPGEPVILHF